MVLTTSLSDVVFCSCTRAWYTDGGRCLFLWIQNRAGIMVGATDCRSAGPRFNSGWKSWFIFMTGSDNLMNHPAQRYNTMSPIRTVITTITRKSVNILGFSSFVFFFFGGFSSFVFFLGFFLVRCFFFGVFLRSVFSLCFSWFVFFWVFPGSCAFFFFFWFLFVRVCFLWFLFVRVCFFGVVSSFVFCCCVFVRFLLLCLRSFFVVVSSFVFCCCVFVRFLLLCLRSFFVVVSSFVFLLLCLRSFFLLLCLRSFFF